MGISNTAVIPPTIAALPPELRSSVSVEPGSLKCVWVSIHPGKTTNPLASNISLASLSIYPISMILPSLIAISWFLRSLSM